ncbi:MAG: hypothetical protein SGPRY_000769 [Prymnesium sp.]
MSPLSPLDQERLAFGPEMLTLSFFAVLVGGVVCFILSLIVEINETRRANTLLDGVSTKVLHQALLSVQEPSHVRRGAIISPVLRLRNHSMGASKHDSDVKLLIMGKVDDPFTSDAIPLVLREVEEFEAMMRRLSKEEVLFIYGAMARLGNNASAEEVREKVIWENFTMGSAIKGAPLHSLTPHGIIVEQVDKDDLKSYIAPGSAPSIFFGRQWERLSEEAKKAFSVKFAYFLHHPKARLANLAAVHVLVSSALHRGGVHSNVLRVYTTHAFKYINGPLRNSAIFGHGKRSHPLPLMVTFLADAIKKLRRVFLSESEQVHEHHKTLWRGMRNLEASDDFLAMDGGVEAAPMSTTSDLAVAARYAASKKSLLFKLKVNNFIQFGADIQWLSAFPLEAEVVRECPCSLATPTYDSESSCIQTT